MSLLQTVQAAHARVTRTLRRARGRSEAGSIDERRNGRSRLVDRVSRRSVEIGKEGTARCQRPVSTFNPSLAPVL